MELKGVSPDTEQLVLPGMHFLDVSAPGYEPRGLNLDVKRFEPANVRFDLVPAGPEGDADGFFLQRFTAGDRSYMTLLAEKLDVDYLLIPDPHEEILRAWLIDREGRTVEHVVLWKAGDTTESGSLRAAGLLDPLHQMWDHSRTTPGTLLSLPAPGPELTGDQDLGKRSTTWTTYAITVSVILLVGIAAGTQRDGGSRIEATW